MSDTPHFQISRSLPSLNLQIIFKSSGKKRLVPERSENKQEIEACRKPVNQLVYSPSSFCDICLVRSDSVGIGILVLR